MPPKKKAVEKGDEVEPERETSERELITSPLSSAASNSTASSVSTRSSGTVSSEQLERILEANMTSMMALLDRRAAASDHTSSSGGEGGRPLLTRVDIPKWVEGENPSDYFAKYEQALSHKGVERSKWGSLLQVYISGSAQASFKQVNPELLKDYDQVKCEMLESLGDTPERADKRWFGLSRQRGENHRALFRRVHNTGYRRMDGLKSKEECCNKMILSKFMTLLSSDCYASVAAKRPKNGQEAAKYAQEFEEDVSFSRSLQPGSSGGHYHSYKRENNNGIVNAQGGVSGVSQNQDSDIGQSSEGSSNQASESKGEYPTGRNFDDRKQVTCYGCGEVGHIRPNCPYKVRSVRSIVEKKAVPTMLVKGVWLV